MAIDQSDKFFVMSTWLLVMNAYFWWVAGARSFTHLFPGAGALMVQI
jgi:hypothetical protein